MKTQAKNKGIAFTAILVGMKTITDGSWRVTFDVSPEQKSELIRLSDFNNTYLQLAVVPIEDGVFDG